MKPGGRLAFDSLDGLPFSSLVLVALLSCSNSCALAGSMTPDAVMA